MTVVAMRQRTPEWHEARRHGIGSSDSPIIAGVAPWGDLMTLYAQKRGIIDSPIEETEVMRWGIRLEDAVAEAYAERTGRTVRRVHAIQQHPQHEWLIASLDRRVVGERRLVEIKTTGYAGDRWGPDGSAEIPDYYLVQVQHQLAVTGYEVADVPVLIGGRELRVFTIERDAELIDALIELDAEFWRHVTDGTAPDPVAIAARGRRVVPLREGEVEADADLQALLVAGHQARQAAKEAKEASEAIDDQVKAVLADHVGARAPQVGAVYRSNKDTTKVGWELIAKAYRKAIETGERPDCDAIESLFTITTPGARPLRYVVAKEEPEA